MDCNQYATILARTISEDAPDPRIQVELERLNTSTDTINKLEVELDEARLAFRQLLADSTQRIDALGKKLGKCVQQARPYYDARIKAKQSLQHTQTACVQYEKAMSEHSAAREMVYLAEEGLMNSGCAFDQTWQEMLNHASSKVNAAEQTKNEYGLMHQKASMEYQESEARVQKLQQQLKRAIARSSLNTRRSLLQISNVVRMKQLQLLPYFEAKSQVNQQLEIQKQRVRELETHVTRAKENYSSALDALESISEQIHSRRKSALDLGVRGVGVGAESPPLPGEITELSSTSASVLQTPPQGPSSLAQTSDSFPETKTDIPEKETPQMSSSSDWQIVTGASILSSLTVEEASISDNESLASIEMLSDEVIAGLMLDDDTTSPSDYPDANTNPFLTQSSKKEHLVKESDVGVTPADSSATTRLVENKEDEVVSVASPKTKYSSPVKSHQNLEVEANPIVSKKVDSVGRGRSPSRSPTRPSSLALSKCNSPKKTEEPVTSIVSVTSVEEMSYAETVNETDSSCGSSSKGTPAYAPLNDALESPLTFPPPSYPPPPPPRNIKK